MLGLSVAIKDRRNDRSRGWLHSRGYVACVVDLVGEDMVRMPLGDLRRGGIWEVYRARLFDWILLLLVELLGLVVLLRQLFFPQCFVCKGSGGCTPNSRRQPVAVMSTIFALDRLSMFQGWLVVLVDRSWLDRVSLRNGRV